MDTFTPKQIKEFKEAYNIYDEEGNGKMDSDTCCRAMRACGLALSNADIAEIVTDLDLNSDGEVNFDCFLALLEQYQKPMPTAADLEAAFKRIDADGSGKVTAKELRHYLQSVGETLSEEEMEEMLKDIDQDGDGEIDYHEFSSLMTRTSSYNQF